MDRLGGIGGVRMYRLGGIVGESVWTDRVV